MNATDVVRDDLRFGFGRNWRAYVASHFDEKRLIQAEECLAGFLRMSDLAGRTFLDIGCGSGLFSLAAHRLGAEEVISFDIDPESVACCTTLWEQADSPKNWKVMSGSILDDSFVETLPEADIVYSWGVLHHTGEMYVAIRKAIEKIRPGGLFYIAIYNKQEFRSLRGLRGSHFWFKVKRAYNRSGPVGRAFMRVVYQAKEIAGMLLSLKNPIRVINEYSSRRGMSWGIDTVDWLGGYPYEFAQAHEIFDYCRTQFDLVLENLFTTNSLGCNEFLLRRPEEPSI